jgi:hypothetical protein
MSQTISERASAAVKQPGIGHNKPPKSQRIQCPCCEFEWDLFKGFKPRSIEQHRRFFGLVNASFAQWPEKHERQFSDTGELRSWLIMKAGWKETVLSMPMVGIKAETAAIFVGAAFKAIHAHAVCVGHRGSLIVMRPKSIKFATMKHMEFVALNQAVDDVLKDVFGVTGDELLEQHRTHA